MIERVQEFAHLLRKSGVRVSVSEVVDAVRAAQAVGLSRGDDFRHALAASLVKRPGDARTFEELFSLYFLRGADLARDLAGTPLVDLLGQAGLSEDDIERILAELATQAAALSPVGRVALGLRESDPGPLMTMAGLRADEMRMVSPLQVGYYAHRALEALGVAGAEADLRRLLAGLRSTVGPEAVAALERAIKENLQALRQAVRRHVQETFEQQNLSFREELHLRSLAERPFTQLREEDLQELRVEVKRLARKLRTQAAMRPQVRRRGRLDVRKTLRRSLRTGGVPFALHHRRKRIERPRLVILCDISDSVRHVSRFMLELVYTLQELFDRVRSFVFVSDLGETTRLFRACEIDRAVALAYGGEVVNVHANSNYGRALEMFWTRYSDAVTSKTTVIVIGDARNNYHPSYAHRLADLRRRAKRVLWLNPESPGAWGFGDSVMREYETHCDRVVVAQNLESLRKVVDDLVL